MTSEKRQSGETCIVQPQLADPGVETGDEVTFLLPEGPRINETESRWNFKKMQGQCKHFPKGTVSTVNCDGRGWLSPGGEKIEQVPYLPVPYQEPGSAITKYLPTYLPYSTKKHIR